MPYPREHGRFTRAVSVMAEMDRWVEGEEERGWGWGVEGKEGNAHSARHRRGTQLCVTSATGATREEDSPEL